MIICAIIYFLFTLMISAKIYINYRAVPPGVNCASLVDNYSNEQLTDLAGLEYLYLDSLEHKLHDLMKQVSQTGAMPCFCQNEADNGESADKLYEVDYGSDILALPICEL